MEMNEKDEIEGKESGIKIVMHDFESVFPKDDPSVIGNFINSMSVGLWPILYGVIKPIKVYRTWKKHLKPKFLKIISNDIIISFFLFFENMTFHIYLEFV